MNDFIHDFPLTEELLQFVYNNYTCQDPIEDLLEDSFHTIFHVNNSFLILHLLEIILDSFDFDFYIFLFFRFLLVRYMCFLVWVYMSGYNGYMISLDFYFIWFPLYICTYIDLDLVSLICFLLSQVGWFIFSKVQLSNNISILGWGRASVREIHLILFLF